MGIFQYVFYHNYSRMAFNRIFILFYFIGPSMLVAQKPYALNGNRELFIDNFFIDQLCSIEIKPHPPIDEGIVLNFDKPWEGPFCVYVTMIKDNDTYRAYYRGSQGGKDGNNNEVTCYAESKDGIKWDKPNLGIHTIQGSKDNYVILANVAPVPHNFSTFLDKNPIWYDGGFAAYKGFRSVGRTKSIDFINWSEPEAMTFGDTPLEHLYTQQTSPYFRAPHIYVAIGGRFMPGRQVLTEEQAKKFNVDPGYFKDCSDVYFMTSRGGNVYDRTFMEAFIRPGIGLNNWVSRSNYPALNVVQTSPTEMSIYVNQDYAQPTAHLHRYSLRLDGFTSLSAPYKGGEALSKVFTFSGKELEINYSTSAAGELKFEIQDENGKPIHDYTMDDSDTIIGNEISRIVTWKGNKNIESLSSKMIRLRIFMKDADLYSLKFN